MKLLLTLIVISSIYSCNQQKSNCDEINQTYTKKIDSLEKELVNYKALHDVAKEIIESDSSTIVKN